MAGRGRARLRERLGATLVGLKDSAGDLAYARAVAAAVPAFDVFPSSEATLGAADADGFAGCISATVNLTAPFAQSAWAGRGTAAGAAAVRKAADLRAIVSGHPLIAAVKAALASRYADPAWARVALPLQPLAAEPAERLREALGRRAAEP